MARTRYVHHDDYKDVTMPVRSWRAEVLTGPERRRTWADETKIAIVTGALSDGVVVSEFARRHNVTASHLFGWIRQFRDAALATIAPPEPMMFAPVVVDMMPITTEPAPQPAEPPADIEISVGLRRCASEAPSMAGPWQRC